MSQKQKFNITVIGCGKMGAAMIQGWLKKDLLNHIDIVDPHDIPPSIAQSERVFHVKQLDSSTLKRTDMVVLCVKPQIMDIVCDGLKDMLLKATPILSIAAGKNLSYFESQFGEDKSVIRTMPNLPATISKSMTALIANKSVTADQKELADMLMKAIGETTWIEDESLMDAVTAVSGSGPAYMFHLAEVMANAGEKLGLSPEQSMVLARQTVIGAAALLEQSEDITAAQLREAVTSKGGTTEAALDVLMDGQMQEVYDKALLAAYMRGKELAG